jgi:hypothetical protein
MDELYEKYLYGCLFLQNKLMIYVNNNNAYSAVNYNGNSSYKIIDDKSDFEVFKNILGQNILCHFTPLKI